MSIFAIIAAIVIVAILIASFIARKAIGELIKFKKMSRDEQEAAIEKAKDENRYWSGRHDKVSPELIFGCVFLALSCLCAWCGLYYTCGYTLFWGAMILSEGITNQVRLFIMNHANPNVVEGATIYEFRTA
jgi:hypothetical protein